MMSFLKNTVIKPLFLRGPTFSRYPTISRGVGVVELG